MADQDTSAVKALNDLIATCRDAEEGYAKAAKGMHDNALSDQLTGILGQRRLRTLQNRISHGKGHHA